MGVFNMVKVKTVREYLGEITPGGILLLSYDQYSLGWKIGVKLVKEEIENGNFALLTNVAVPFRKFCARIEAAGLDVIQEGKNGNLAIINVFEGEAHYDFVYNVDKVDGGTFISKYVEVKKQITKKYNLKERKVVHAFVTLDTLYERFGASTVKKLFQARLFAGEKLVEKGYWFWDILIVNRDVVPKELHSWMVSISDYVIFTQGILKENEFVENIAVLKGLSREFRPVILQMKTPSVLTPRERIHI
ncbi:hypothetical protein [Thermococcus sp. GR6]|uniref:hypothetical protein n=1 Tax=Thermococcus sp. GR6 TaxID=1638256 RepID=UPI001F0DE8B5|nr:hypothetical protein [Thermococcus sp. GR6]